MELDAPKHDAISDGDRIECDCGWSYVGRSDEQLVQALNSHRATASPSHARCSDPYGCTREAGHPGLHMVRTTARELLRQRGELAAAPVGGQADEGSLTTCPSCGEGHTDEDVCRPEPVSISQRRDGQWRHDRCDGYVIFRAGGWECGECGVGGQAEPSDRPEVIVLCGSTRFKDAFNAANARLTMQGKLVISLGVFGHVDMPDHDWTTNGSADKRMLDQLHRRKIDLADRVLVINIGGYIGDSTRGEIAYAVERGIPVDYLEVDACASCGHDAETHATLEYVGHLSHPFAAAAVSGEQA